MCCRAGAYWELGNLETRRRIQKWAYPCEIVWNPETCEPRTVAVCETFRISRLISSSYDSETNKKRDKPCDLSHCVDLSAHSLNLELVPNLYASQELLDYLTSVGIEVPDQL